MLVVAFDFKLTSKSILSLTQRVKGKPKKVSLAVHTVRCNGLGHEKVVMMITELLTGFRYSSYASAAKELCKFITPAEEEKLSQQISEATQKVAGDSKAQAETLLFGFYYVFVLYDSTDAIVATVNEVINKLGNTHVFVVCCRTTAASQKMIDTREAIQESNN
jgi:hypothetical protein